MILLPVVSLTVLMCNIIESQNKTVNCRWVYDLAFYGTCAPVPYVWGWKMSLKKTRFLAFKKNLKTSKVQILGLLRVLCIFVQNMFNFVF